MVRGPCPGGCGRNTALFGDRCKCVENASKKRRRSQSPASVVSNTHSHDNPPKATSPNQQLQPVHAKQPPHPTPHPVSSAAFSLQQASLQPAAMPGHPAKQPSHGPPPPQVKQQLQPVPAKQGAAWDGEAASRVPVATAASAKSPSAGCHGCWCC